MLNFFYVFYTDCNGSEYCDYETRMLARAEAHAQMLRDGGLVVWLEEA